MKRRLAPALAAVLALSGCGFFDQFLQMKNFAHCKFRLAGVEQVRLAGVRLDGKRTLKDLNLMDGIRLAAALKGNALPLDLVLNVEARNPNAEPAAMNRLGWILLVDGRELTHGQLDRRVEIAPNGGTAPIPLEVGVDLRQALAGQTGEALANLAFNLAGEGTHPTHVTLKVKPSILIAGQQIELPDYLTISTEFGGDAAR